MQKTWDEIRELLEVRQRVSSDAEWDELKIKAIEATIEAIIDRLSRFFPDQPATGS